METKEAIKYVEGFNLTFNEERKKNLKQVQSLLEEGGKYKAIVDELKKFNDGKVIKINENEWWKYRMSKIIQKYFPKPIKKIITIEIEGESEYMEKFISRLNSVVGQINSGVRTNIKECD